MKSNATKQGKRFSLLITALFLLPLLCLERSAPGSTVYAQQQQGNLGQNQGNTYCGKFVGGYWADDPTGVNHRGSPIGGGFIPCGQSVLWLILLGPSSFDPFSTPPNPAPGTYVTLYNAELSPADAQLTTGHATAAVSFSDWAPVSSCPACGTPPSQFNISILNMRWQSPPKAFEPATLIASLHITGFVDHAGYTAGYTINLLIGQDIGSRAVNYWFNSDDVDSAAFLSSRRLTNGDFDLQISQLRIPTTLSSRISLTIISNDEPSVQGAFGQPLYVAPSAEGYKHCLGLIYNWVTSLWPSGIGIPRDAVKLNTTLTWKTLKSQERSAACGDNAECQAQELNNLRVDYALAGLDATISNVNKPLGWLAVQLKNAILSAPDIVKCGIWCKDYGREVLKDLLRRGTKVNGVLTGSPVYPLVTNKAGQRAGFLPNGQIVEEIPGSQAIMLDEKRFVLFPDETDVGLQIVGYAAGTMNVDAVFAQNGGIAASYNNVPVTQGMKATLSSSDQQAKLNIDNNGDGRLDQSRAPDALESLGGGSANNSYTFKETGFAVSGRIWQLWQGGRSYGDSLYINGFPITSVRPEVSTTDGKSYQTQWFERARYELHPENQPPYDVLLGLLGATSAKGRQNEAPFKPVANPGGGVPWFALTQHTLGDSSDGGKAIAAYWNSLGGLAQFGFPLSQPFMEKSKADGKIYLVQYFERQRFEYHPENKGTKYEVLLGLLGFEQMNNGAQPQPSSGYIGKWAGTTSQGEEFRFEVTADGISRIYVHMHLTPACQGFGEGSYVDLVGGMQYFPIVGNTFSAAFEVHHNYRTESDVDVADVSYKVDGLFHADQSATGTAYISGQETYLRGNPSETYTCQGSLNLIWSATKK